MQPEGAGIQIGFMARALVGRALPTRQGRRSRTGEEKTMTRFCLQKAVVLPAVLAAMALAPAAALANCDWYVKTSLEQQQRNQQLKCGFSGAEWSVDKGAHSTWCASVGP